MIEIDPFALIQVDATIIVGVLILLTLTKFAKTIDENIPVAVAWIVLPFGFSAILALIGILLNSIQKDSTLAMLLAMIGAIVGFAYLIIAILDFTRDTKKKK